MYTKYLLSYLHLIFKKLKTNSISFTGHLKEIDKFENMIFFTTCSNTLITACIYSYGLSSPDFI